MKTNEWAMDLHIPSPYASKVSSRMAISTISDMAHKKGITLMGTGDCWHPEWRQMLNGMEEEEGSGFLYHWDKEVQFVPTVEVCCSYNRKRIHMLMVFKNLEVADAARGKVAGFSEDIDSDGRPEMRMTAGELMNEIKGSRFGDDALVIPAHCLTPWFGIMGDRNHLFAMSEVLEEKPDAIETGLSADRKMVMAIPELRDCPLVSFSDAHSLHSTPRV